MELSKRNIFLLIYKILAIVTIVMLTAFSAMEAYIHSYIIAAFVALSVVFIAYWLIKEWHVPQFSRIWNFCILIFWAIFIGNREYTKYKWDTCEDKFGLSYNKNRVTIGAPVIPASWTVDSKNKGSVLWWVGKGKEKTIGHESKFIVTDTCCSIEEERDEYNLKPLGKIKCDLRISTIYAKGKGTDTLTYYYDIGDSTKQISRQSADSIFKAEGIKKDY